MATKAQVRFGRYTGKNVVAKDVEYLTSVIDASSGNVRNMELTPAGGVVRMQQDILSTSAEKIYNYASYIIGDLLYYGYVDCEGVAGGIVTYRIRVDAATTMWRAGAFNIRNYCLYSPLGDQKYDDTRRARSPIATRYKFTPDETARLWEYNNLSYGSIVLNVAAIAIPDYSPRCMSTSPANVQTYIMSMDAFNRFYNKIKSWDDATHPIAAYLKSILTVTWIPLAPQNIINLSNYLSMDYSVKGNLYLFNPADLTDSAIIYVGDGLYDLRVPGQYLPLTATTPPIYIENINNADARTADIEYNASGFGKFKFSAKLIPENIIYINSVVYLDMSGLSFACVPVVHCSGNNTYFLNELCAYGTFTCQIPMLSETDISNWQLREGMLRRDVGLSAVSSVISTGANIASGNVAGGAKELINLGSNLISAVQQQQDFEWSKRFSGGSIIGTLGSSLQRVYDGNGYVIYSYYPYESSDFQTVYNFPDNQLRNIHTDFGGSPGYVQTVNCNIFRLGYPEEIVKSAESAFDSGVWIT